MAEEEAAKHRKRASSGATYYTEGSVALAFDDLDDDPTRQLMREEVESDIAAGQLYYRSRLSPQEQKDYPDLLLKATDDGDDETHTAELRKNSRFNATEVRNARGGQTVANVPHNAAETLAGGEFSRFYIRALCRRAIEEGHSLQLYRAKYVANPRAESETKINTVVDPTALLRDLREHHGVDTVLGLPAGPNSELLSPSVQLLVC